MSVHDHFDETMGPISAFPLTPAEHLRAEQFAVWGRQLAGTWSSLLRRLKLLLPAHA
ncbi:MAG: hypothetical protein U1E35_08780 [Rhodospirillales bacterium]